MRFWYGKYKVLLSLGFGIIGSITVLFPLDVVIELNIWIRALIFFLFLLLLFVVSLVWIKYEKNKKRKRIYSLEKAQVYFEYGDIRQTLANEAEVKEKFTIVVPVFTDVGSLFDHNLIKETSIHGICLNYLSNKLGQKLDIEVLKKAKGTGHEAFVNQEVSVGKIGQWFFLKPDELGVDAKIRFLFIETCNLIDKNGVKSIDLPSKDQYLLSIQSLFDAMKTLEEGEKIYIPLIGAGNGNAGTNVEIMYILAAMLRFNKDKLKQEVHVVVDEKLRNEVPIHQLQNI